MIKLNHQMMKINKKIQNKKNRLRTPNKKHLMSHLTCLSDCHLSEKLALPNTVNTTISALIYNCLINSSFTIVLI
jgi:hypothetical protein